MLTQTKQPVPEDYLIVSKIDRMPEPTAFEIETAKKSKEGLELEVHVLAEVVPGPGLVKRCYVKVGTNWAPRENLERGTLVGLDLTY